MSEPVRALDKGIYTSAVDTVGGNVLAKIISLINNPWCLYHVVVMLLEHHLSHQYFHSSSWNPIMWY
ncbi:MAG: hypothetical protein CM15mP108_2450 [Gammaproteobacteria bacterium]|nr:MAG: hypothetical protein CM15mP108_2450 [Gammaproteobacteria bacterium]